MALSAEQRRIARIIGQEGRKAKATRKQVKSAYAAAQVESNITNMKGGDRDSVGVFQIRSGIHGPIGGSVRKSSQWYFKNAKAADKGQSSGQLSQDTERSAFPDKYGKPDVQKLAGSLTRKYFSGRGSSGKASGRTKTTTTPGVDRSEDRSAVISNYLSSQGRNPKAFFSTALQLRELKDTPGKTVTQRVKSKKRDVKGSVGSSRNGVVKMDGYEVNASIAADLKYARAHGWKGKVTSGYRSNKKQAEIYASGVRPAAPPGQSMHRFKRKTKGAVDVSDGAALGKYLPKRSKLKFAGSADPVHYSVGAPKGSY